MRFRQFVRRARFLRPSRSRTAEIRAAESAARWRALFEGMREGFFVGEIVRDPACGATIDFRVIETNPAFEAHTGLSATQVLGRTAREVVPGFQQELIETFGHVVDTGEAVQLEIDIPALGGRWYEARVQPADRPGRFAVLFLEITERKAAEAALRDSEERFRATFEQAAAGIAHVGLDGRWLRVNAKLCAMLGYTQAEMVRTTFQDITHPDDLGADLENVRRLLAGELATFSMEKRYVRSDRTPLWINLTVSLARDPAGAPRHFISVVEDITERKRTEAQLAETGERLSRALTAARMGTWDRNLLTDHAIWDAREYELFGFDPAAGPISREAMLARMHPEDRPRVEEVVAAAVAAGDGAFEWECRVLRPEGGFRWVRGYGNAVPDDSGRAVRVVGLNFDVTETRAAQEQLRDSEARFRTLFEGVPIGVVVTDPDTLGVLAYNDRVCEMLGYTRDEFACLTLGEIDALETPDEKRSRAAMLVNTSARVEFETRQRRRNGTLIDVHVTAQQLLVEGRPSVLSAWQDITARRAAELALRESESQLRDLVATLDLAAVMVRDLDGTIRAWSEGCERLYGWRREEVIGSLSHTLLRTVVPVPLAEIEAALLRGGEWSGDLVHSTRDGREITVAARQVVRRNRAGQPVAVMESVSDVTALRAARAELYRLNRDLETRVEEEVAAREAAQAKLAHAARMQALGQLAGGIAHDFNNVLQAVQGGIALIESRAGKSEDVTRFARMVLDSAARGSAVTQRLLAFARRSDLRAELVETRALLDGLRDIFVHTLGAGIEVRIEADEDLPRLYADKGQLETVLINLATNGRDAMPSGGTLTITATADAAQNAPPHPAQLHPGHYVRIAVNDTGTGMDAATLGRAIEPFFTAKGEGQGTGLGLPMAKGFAEQSGGALAIESTVDLGTTVTLWLPAGAPRPLPAQSAGGPRAVPGASKHASPGRILLVDDDDVVRETLAVQLEDAGFTVLRAAGGAEARAVLNAGEPADALVTDLSMPGVDGISLIRDAQERNPHLPAVLLTGYAGDGAALAVGQAVPGSFSLLRKPISGAQLADHVAAMMAGESIPSI